MKAGNSNSLQENRTNTPQILNESGIQIYSMGDVESLEFNIGRTTDDKFKLSLGDS